MPCAVCAVGVCVCPLLLFNFCNRASSWQASCAIVRAALPSGLAPASCAGDLVTETMCSCWLSDDKKKRCFIVMLIAES